MKNNQQRCLWCGFKKTEHPNLDHCFKMIKRALSRTRKNGDGCHHCGHPKNEHKGRSYIIIDEIKKIIDKRTMCCHLKLDKRRCGEDIDDYCECEQYL